MDMSSLHYFLPLPVVHSSHFSSLPKWSPKDNRDAAKLKEVLRECGGRVFVDSIPEFSTPQFGMVDMSEIDAIFISNYHNMVALPFVTEYSHFRGKVYATEPTLQAGRQFMEEIVQYIERFPKASSTNLWKEADVLRHLPPPLRDSKNPHTWKQCYSMHDVQASLARVQMVGFNEKIDIFGSLQAIAISSGYCIGSCNWVLQTEHEKLCYVAGSSTLTTHPKPMEHAPLRDSELMILTQVTNTPTVNPDSMIGEFCMNTALTLRNGGNVLVPVYPNGVTYDLFECLSVHLDSCGLSTVPMYFISPQADSSLAYSNIFAEWLSQGKQSKVYLPEPPFPHAELLSSGRLKSYATIHGEFSGDFRTPCVLFTGHPSLRFGDAVHFIEMWKNTSANAIIFTEPDFHYLDALAPYQPIAMKVLYCPIDTSLNFTQANKLIRDLKPRMLVTEERYLQPPPQYPHRTDLMIDTDHSVITHKPTSVLSLPIKRKMEKIQLDPEIASSLVPTEVRPGVAIAMVTGALTSKDNQHILKPLSAGSKRKLDSSGLEPSGRKSYFWGDVVVDDFVSKLSKHGLKDLKVETSPTGGHIVHLPNEDTLIQLEEGSTHIICEGNEGLRVKLKDILLQCLNRL